MTRPSSYSQEIVELAEEYLSYFFNKDEQPEHFEQAVPTIVGLCSHINRGTTTVYNWANDDDPKKAAFRDILDKVLEIQHLKLVNGGLMGFLNPVITKMMLTKHGYSDKQEVDHTTKGEAMQPAIQFVPANTDD